METVTYSIYEVATGRILYSLTASNPEQAAAQVITDDSRDVAVGASDPSLDYVFDGAVTRRPEMAVRSDVSLAIGEETVVIVPAGCSVTFDGETGVVIDGQLEISGDVAAEYELVLSLFPYLDHALKVTVHEA